MSYNNRNALRLEDLVDESCLRGKLLNSVNDPLLEMEYVSPVNQGRFSTIGRLESGVSLLQSAQTGIEKTKQWLMEIRQFLESTGNQNHQLNIPKSVANRFISDRLALIENLVRTSTFQGRVVLDGSYGVRGSTTGNRLRFVRGSARVVSSPEKGFTVEIVQPPRSSFLVGTGELTVDEIRREKLIALNDGIQEVRYHIRKNETPDSLIQNLRQCLFDHHFDVEVFKSDNSRLFFKHNQLGSKNNFRGLSFSSRLVSEIPGQYNPAVPGIDIAGKIGGEGAHGDGGFLIGDKGNKQTDGLIVYYDGNVEFPGQHVGTVHTIQNGMTIPLDSTGTQMELLSLPSIDPLVMAVGVANASGYENLGSLRVIKNEEWADALRVVVWSILYLDFISKELKQKETEYISRTLEMLKGSTAVFSANESTVLYAKDKATDMISQINAMLRR